MKIIMWILLFTFVLWGGSSAVLSRGREGNVAGIVFGKKVPLKEYSANYNAVINQGRLLYGEKFGNIKKFLNLEEQTWDRIILLRQAKRLRINVKNSEVIERIARMPIFQDKSGKFINEIYSRIMEYYLRTSPRNFEEEIRQSIMLSKLSEAVVKDVKAADEEVLEEYKKKNEKIDVDFILINADEFKSAVEVTDTQIEEYYSNHREEFKTPPRINVEYIPIEFASFKQNVSVSDEEIDEYCQGHKDDYKKDWQEAAQKGVDQGDAASKINERIKTLLIETKAEEKADQTASFISYELAREKNPDFEAAAKKYNMPVKETGLFALDEPIAGIGLSYQFAMKAFGLAPQEISSPVKTNKGYYILKYKDKNQPYVPLLPEVRIKVKDVVIMEQARLAAKQKAREYADSIKEKLDAGLSFKDAAAELKLAVRNTGFFTQAGYIPNIGNSDEFKNAVFSQEAGKTCPVTSIPQGAAIPYVVQKQPIDEEKYKGEKEDFKRSFLEQKKADYFKEWFNELKQKAGLKILVKE